MEVSVTYVQKKIAHVKQHPVYLSNDVHVFEQAIMLHTMIVIVIHLQREIYFAWQHMIFKNNKHEFKVYLSRQNANSLRIELFDNMYFFCQRHFLHERANRSKCVASFLQVHYLCVVRT